MISVPLPSTGIRTTKTVMQILCQTGELPVLEDASRWNVIKAGYARQTILNRFAVDQMEQPDIRSRLLECLRRPEVRQAAFWMRLEGDIIRDLSALLRHQTPETQTEPAREGLPLEEPPAKVQTFRLPHMTVEVVRSRPAVVDADGVQSAGEAALGRMQ